ncbi:MAG: DUF3179 domain-containing protein [Acidobacteriota bacterium]
MKRLRHYLRCLAVIFALSLASFSVPQDRSLSSEPIVNLLGLLTSREEGQRRAASREIEHRRDLSAAPGLIELMRIPRYALSGEPGRLLRKLTGKNLGDDWVKWSEWLAEQRIELPPQFLEWKATLFRLLIDPEFARFLYPGVKLRVRAEEIVWGGVKKDAIPALTNPKMIKVSEADYLRDDELVFGIEINGDARAYPLRIMDWHEMLNDRVGDRSVSLAYCTLCRSGILFDTTVGGDTFTFGSSGLLYRSNKLMYDHQTESLWMTMRGEPVSGPLAMSEIELKKLPVVVASWKEWRDQHPRTLVLSLDTGFKRDYRPGAAYSEYFASPDLMFPAPGRDNRLRPKEEVFALTVNGQPKAYALNRLRDRGVLNDEVAGEKLVLIAERSEVRVYARGERIFKSMATANRVEAQDGSVWSLTEDALVNPSTGERLPRIAGHLSYWFGWHSFYPSTLLYDGRK